MNAENDGRNGVTLMEQQAKPAAAATATTEPAPRPEAESAALAQLLEIAGQFMQAGKLHQARALYERLM